MKQSAKLRAGIVISEINTLKEKLFNILFEYLSHPAKDFKITYKKKQYHFYLAFDADEAEDLTREKINFINIIIRDCLKYSVGTNSKYRQHAWDIIMGILDGQDPQHHQFIKYDDADIYEVKDEAGNPIIAIPLNMENYQVKENLGLLEQIFQEVAPEVTFKTMELQNILNNVADELKEELDNDQQD